MDLKDGFNKAVDNIKDAAGKTIDNAKDTVNEASHKGAAESEQAKRDVAGDQMTTSEKAGSMLNQAKNSVQGDVDATKRDVRNNT